MTQDKAAFAQALVTGHTGSLSISASLNFEVMGASSKAGYTVARLLSVARQNKFPVFTYNYITKF